MQQKRGGGTQTASEITPLYIGKAGGQTLTNNQKAFNKLTERIEKLHLEIASKNELFEAAVKLYAQQLHPAHQQMLLQKRRLLDVLWDNYQQKKLSAGDQRHLRAILQQQLQEYMDLVPSTPDEKLKAIFRELEGETYETFQKRENEMKKAMMQEMFAEMDMEIDMDEVDMTNEHELGKKIAEAKEKLEQQKDQKAEKRGQRQKQKKITKAQFEKEQLRQAAATLKQKNISTIYKQLAKLFHPDLEQDEYRKAEKEVLMKELTAAYESKNLHALLSLELKWIHKENDHLESLTEEKLAVYLQILREQAEALEKEKKEIFLQPRYAVLYQELGEAVIKHPLTAVQKACLEVKTVITNLSTDIADYASDHGLRHIKSLIKQWKQYQHRGGNSSYEEELLSRFFE